MKLLLLIAAVLLSGQYDALAVADVPAAAVPAVAKPGPLPQPITAAKLDAWHATYPGWSATWDGYRWRIAPVPAAAPAAAERWAIRYERRQVLERYGCDSGACRFRRVWRMVPVRYRTGQSAEVPSARPAIPRPPQRWTVNGDTRRHLIGEHGFSAAKLAGLSPAELERLHSWAHEAERGRVQLPASVAAYK